MTTHLKINNLVKKFGSLTATNNVSFEVAQGESIALVGPNGAGKTTIFSQIMGEIRQNSGEIIFEGHDVSLTSTHNRIHRGLSRTYQVPRPFHEMNILENIRVGLMSDNLWEMVMHRPNVDEEIELALSVGFKEVDLQNLPSELSMGDLRKLEMARTLATRPSLMLLDEVFAGLTVGEIGQISDLINRKREEGLTFIIVSHDLKSLEPLIDRTIAINHGTMIAEGTFKEVMSDSQVRASYLGEE